MPGLVSALKDAGLDVFVSETVNAQRLTSWIREFDNNKKKPKSPDDVRAEIEAYVMKNGKPSAAAKRAAAAIGIAEVSRLGMTKS